VVAPARPQIDDLAAAFARAGVPAVVLVEGDGDSEALDALGAAGVAAGVTMLRHPRADPIALERSVIGYLVNRRAEVDHRAAELEAELTRLALQGQGLDGLAAAIGAFLGRAVVVEGRRGDPLAVHAPADVPAATGAYAVWLSRPASAALRVPIPAGAGEPGIAGSLVLLGDEPPTELDRAVSERVAPVLALELHRDAAVRLAREEARRGDPLPLDGPPWVVLLARQAVADGIPGGMTGGTPGGTPDAAARERVRAELAVIVPPRRATLRGTPESVELRLVAAAPPDDPAGTLLAERVAGYLGRTVAVSRPFAEPGGRPAAEAEARTTLEAASLVPEPPRVARADRLAAYRLLGNLHNLPDGARDARQLLEPILGGRPDVRDEHLATLRAVLDQPGIAEAAAALGVHRNTVAYRVRRIEGLTGWRLGDPDIRLPLAIALRLVQTQQG
ncbi:MAG TPA: helix-turn-helix domain-containing protein, partial [Candidatus Limnocylindrales bacterium]|nr:helix-turn-helix domain-containing protein [Candidatus Limnocylindrales bacterium]